MNYRIPFALLLVLLLVAGHACKNDMSDPGPWPEMKAEAKPWARWWWHGSQVDKENIRALMSQYAEAGFGGLEITPIYGVKGQEDQYLDFLSPQWMDMLAYSASEADKWGMGMDMNLGTGWPFGGPQITPELAASKLILEKFILSAGQSLTQKILPRDMEELPSGVFLETLMAYSDKGEVEDLSGQIDPDGILQWIPSSGRWELYAAFCGKTGQMVKRAAKGGEGFSMDHLSSPALETYFSRFEEAFTRKEKIRSFFNDSYEVYGASWTPGFFDSFLERRAYDLKAYLPLLAGEGDPDLVARVKSDYRQTMAELLLENFTRAWTRWSNEQGVLTRNQAHGSPGNLIDLYAAVDIPECEIFGHRQFDIPGMRVNSDDSRNVEPNPMMLKLATSAAHVSGKNLISNETFTWLGEHFRVELSQCKPEVEEAFLAGINHVFYHGIPYSPPEARWPGWLFYASTHFGPTNSFWDHLPAMNTYIGRCQSMLQSGKADNEILVYWPIFDIWHQADGMEMQLSVHNIREWLVYPGIDRMAAQGYSYDFISDALLEGVKLKEGKLVSAGADPSSYQALVIPACKRIPPSTLEKILELAQAGATVIFERLPEDVPGLFEYELRKESIRRILGEMVLKDAGQGIRKAETGKGAVLSSTNLGKALEYEGIGRERIGDLGLKFTRRRTDDGAVYFLVNHSSEYIDAMVPLNTHAASVMLMDPQDGDYGLARMETGGIRTRARVQLRPGETIFLKTSDSIPQKAPPWHYEHQRLASQELNESWELHFLKGGPELPAPLKLDELRPWTELGDSAMLDFSGIASYITRFHMKDVHADRYLLQLGKIHGSARILLNGKEVGHVWSLPAEIDLGPDLKKGENKLEIQVANLMANRIRYMDRQKIDWKIFHNINIVNIEYQAFDASDWPTEASGLAGPVRLIPVKLNGIQ